jgi:hypothetical protein
MPVDFEPAGQVQTGKLKPPSNSMQADPLNLRVRVHRLTNGNPFALVENNNKLSLIDLFFKPVNMKLSIGFRHVRLFPFDSLGIDSGSLFQRCPRQFASLVSQGRLLSLFLKSFGQLRRTWQFYGNCRPSS